jgi:hypothetical protein
MLLVRTDLKMQTGKIASQCSHATLGLYKDMLFSKNPAFHRILEEWDDLGGMYLLIDEIVSHNRIGLFSHYRIVPISFSVTLTEYNFRSVRAKSAKGIGNTRFSIH